MHVHNIAIKELLIKNCNLESIKKISVLSSLTDNNEVWGYEEGYDIHCEFDWAIHIEPLGGSNPNPGLFNDILIGS